MSRLQTMMARSSVDLPQPDGPRMARLRAADFQVDVVEHSTFPAAAGEGLTSLRISREALS